jgi:2-hydroxychromene-2-carboxylate isomerase
MAAKEVVRFHFDPLCPWAWQGSKWIREVAQVRDLDVDWRLFSLEVINSDKDDPLADEHVKGTPALRTLVLVRREAGSDGVGDVYRALGNRTHDGEEELGPDVVRAALEDAGFEKGLVDRALADDSTMAAVRAEHDAAVSEVGAFGVPTIVCESGGGIFGPVVSRALTGEEAGQLWDHVRALAELDVFFELKRERDRGPGE